MPPAMSGTPRARKRSGPSARDAAWSGSQIFWRRFPYGHRRGARSQKGPRPLSPAPWACPPRTQLHARSIGEARYLVQTPIVQANRTELPAPDATGVEGEEIGRNTQAERRPVPAYTGLSNDFPARHLEPRKVAGGSFGRLAFRAEQIGRAHV